MGQVTETRRLAVDCGEAVHQLFCQQHAAEQTDQAAVFVSGLPFCEASLTGWLTELLEPFGKVQQVVLHPSQVRLDPELAQALTQAAADLLQLRRYRP